MQKLIASIKKFRRFIAPKNMVSLLISFTILETIFNYDLFFTPESFEALEIINYPTINFSNTFASIILQHKAETIIFMVITLLGVLLWAAGKTGFFTSLIILFGITLIHKSLLINVGFYFLEIAFLGLTLTDSKIIGEKFSYFGKQSFMAYMSMSYFFSGIFKFMDWFYGASIYHDPTGLRNLLSGYDVLKIIEDYDPMNILPLVACFILITSSFFMNFQRTWKIAIILLFAYHLMGWAVIGSMLGISPVIFVWALHYILKEENLNRPDKRWELKYSCGGR